MNPPILSIFQHILSAALSRDNMRIASNAGTLASWMFRKHTGGKILYIPQCPSNISCGSSQLNFSRESVKLQLDERPPNLILPPFHLHLPRYIQGCINLCVAAAFLANLTLRTVVSWETKHRPGFQLARFLHSAD